MNQVNREGQFSNWERFHRFIIVNYTFHSLCVNDERFVSYKDRLYVRVKLPNRWQGTNDETFSSVLHRY